MRITPKRGKVLSVLKEKKRALTAQEIGACIPDVDLTTIYRSLELFQKEGVVREIILPSKESTYEYRLDVHDHLVCNSCEQVKHIKLKRKHIINLPELKHLDPNSIEITVRGHCKS